MCGFAGFLGYKTNKLFGEALLNEMASKLIYRGPDDSGAWYDDESEIGLGHRRLSILDLSPAGHQPMLSSSGRFVIAFNGEIYNHLNLRKELKNIVWRGHSDTETLLECIESWGIDVTLKKINGMFAFALWDKDSRLLFLARDRMGEKPLYYGWQNNGAHRAFLFGSELKSLKAHPAFKNTIDRGSLCLLLGHSYIPAPYSIYENIYKLEPGCYLTVSLADHNPLINKYWDLVQVAKEGVNHPYSGSLSDALAELETLTRDVVRQQMIADVPIGAFLSGGVDSSTIVALMQAQSFRPVKTFTIGFDEQNYNEAPYAELVAKYLGTDHSQLYVSPTQAFDVIKKLPLIYCEPFADSSQIPTYLVSQLAKKEVTVSLSGDGGDELFCGYNRYQVTDRLWEKLKFIPRPIRYLISRGIIFTSPEQWDAVSKFIPYSTQYSNFGDKMHKGAGLLLSNSMVDLYLRMISHLPNPSDWVIGGFTYPTNFIKNLSTMSDLNAIERMMAIDSISYLPDDILVKLDRAAMSVSLEGRVPFLDYRLVEFAWSLPIQYKLHDGKSKWILRQLLFQYVPKELIERPKMGFGLPLNEWLRGPLREWADTLISENRLIQQGFFHPKPIRKMWEEHLSGRRNWMTQLWNILMFQAWIETN